MLHEPATAAITFAPFGGLRRISSELQHDLRSEYLVHDRVAIGQASVDPLAAFPQRRGHCGIQCRRTWLHDRAVRRKRDARIHSCRGKCLIEHSCFHRIRGHTRQIPHVCICDADFLAFAGCGHRQSGISLQHRLMGCTRMDVVTRRGSGALESDLHQALALDQLRLHYQPQIDTAGRVIGVEALLRWLHPQRGLVSPNEFVPLAESTGLILPIGRWILETSCVLIKNWESDACTRSLQVAVNVSARQFRQADFVEQVKRSLKASGANPARLKLELTESVLLKNVEDTIAKMLAIKRLGVAFSLDDFGTGYSSLSYLAQLPLDQLKIDQSFVRKLPGARKEETIARTIITMGRELDMNVIAEGVESEAQRQFLSAHGCHAYQGYLFSRPLPVEHLTVFLQEADR